MITNEEIDTLDVVLCNMTKLGSSPQFRELFDQAKEFNRVVSLLSHFEELCDKLTVDNRELKEEIKKLRNEEHKDKTIFDEDDSNFIADDEYCWTPDWEGMGN